MSALTDWLQPYRDRLERGQLGLPPVVDEVRRATEAEDLARRRLPPEQLARADEDGDQPLWYWSDATRWLIARTTEPRWLRGDAPGACCCGDEGVGKTQGLVLAALRLARAGRKIAYLPAFEDDISRAWRHWDDYRAADVLLLDELHRLDGQPDVTAGRVIGLIDYRYRNRRPLLAAATCPIGAAGTATNAPSGLYRILGSEVVPRFQWLAAFIGESYRRIEICQTPSSDGTSAT